MVVEKDGAGILFSGAWAMRFSISATVCCSRARMRSSSWETRAWISSSRDLAREESVCDYNMELVAGFVSFGIGGVVGGVCTHLTAGLEGVDEVGGELDGGSTGELVSIVASICLTLLILLESQIHH